MADTIPSRAKESVDSSIAEIFPVALMVEMREPVETGIARAMTLSVVQEFVDEYQ